MLGGILHILVPIGTVFNEQILGFAAAGLGGVDTWKDLVYLA